MKVLFAVGSQSVSETIVKNYQKNYKEILSYENVYYFNAILKKIQKDKSYDRIVISEDLEQFPNNNYEAIDKTIFEKLDEISDEAQDIDGNETSIIFLCSERHTKGSSFLVKLFGIGIYNAILSNEQSTEQVCKLINKPRVKKEAKMYYQIDADDVNYSNKSSEEVSELEIQSILNHFKKLGRNTDKYVESFNNIAPQYTDEQLKIIINCLPTNVKIVLEDDCQKYQELMAVDGIVKKVDRNNLKSEELKKQTGIKIDIIENKINTNKMSGPIVIPSSVRTSKTKGPAAVRPVGNNIEIPTIKNEQEKVKKIVKKSEPITSSVEKSPVQINKNSITELKSQPGQTNEVEKSTMKEKVAGTPKYEEKIITKKVRMPDGRIVVKKQKVRVIPKNVGKQEKTEELQTKPKLKEESNINKNQQENSVIQQPIVKKEKQVPPEVVKRKRKVEEDENDQPKRGRGRPRKVVQEDDDIDDDIMLPGMDDSFEEIEETLPKMEDDFEDVEETLPGMEDDFEDVEESLPGMEDDFEEVEESLPGMEDDFEEVEESLPGMEDDFEEVEESLPGMEDDFEEVEESLTGMEDDFEEVEESLTGMEDDFEEVEESLTGMEDDFEEMEELTSGIEEKFEEFEETAELEEFEELSGLEDFEEFDDDNLPKLEDAEEYTDEVALPGIDELDDLDDDSSIDKMLPENDEDTVFVNGFDDEEEMNYNNDSTSYNQQTSEIESIKPKVDYSMSSLNSLLTKDKKIVTFIGTSKNGTSFLINNLAALFSSLGINTAILDMTKNKNSYYIYTNNEEELRNIAYNSISKLQSGGYAEGIKVNKNLSVYTSLPNDGKDYSDAEPILSTLVQNHSLILIDCDFDTDPSYFASCQEIYLVQSMDILTIQPLTAYLRDLKSKGVLEPEKVRVVINKELKVRSLTTKAIIGGMSFYNDPSMSFMTELFNKDMVKACSIPFDETAYSKYLDSMVNCNVSLNGYSKQFMSKLRNLGDMVYPLVSKSTYGKSTQQVNYGKTAFSNNMNNTLNQMKKKY